MGTVLAIKGASPLARLKRSGFRSQSGRGGEESAAAAYTANLTRLVPAEALAAYALLKEFDDGAGEEGRLAGIFCCLIVLVLRWVMAKDPATGRPQFGMILLSLLTFICWLYAQGDWLWTLAPSPLIFRIAQGGVVLFAVIAPFVVGEKAAAAR